MTREDSGALETRPVQVGNYKFTGKILGKGTFATVEEAIHIHLKVKVIPPYRFIYIIRSFRIVLFQYNVRIPYSLGYIKNCYYAIQPVFRKWKILYYNIYAT